VAPFYEDVRLTLSRLGFSGLEDVYLSEDDGQYDQDIKLFAVVRLTGPSGSKVADSMPTELVEALDRLATAVCCREDGEILVEPEGWELGDVEPLDFDAPTTAAGTEPAARVSRKP
jgi:hypothetical protein